MSAVSNVIEFPRRVERDSQFDPHRAVVQERARIAREVHDLVSHSLATIGLQAAVALQVMEEHPDTAESALRAIRSTTQDALGDLRGVLGVLRQGDDSRTSPALGRLDNLVASTSAAGVLTELHVVGRARPLPAAVDLAAFRVVQESLANVLRHAGAETAVVTIAYERARVVVQVEDDGRGAASGSEVSVGSGSGIAGMRERVLALGGELEAAAPRGGGFAVRASLPVLGRA
jgi:signal transduction histidine kinase